MISYPDYVDKIITRLEAHGYEAFVVGGGLRDILLGRIPNDFDVTTSATPDEMLSVFSDMKAIPTGLKHGTLTVLSNSNAVEVTTYRIDGEYTDSRHPDSVSFTKNICDDLARRDFTVNAMAYNKNTGLVDPFGGERDLKDKVLRAVGNAERRMREDALRIMRALRFEAQLGFCIESSTESALAKCREGLRSVSGERRGVELQKLVSASYPAEPIRRMLRLGIGEYVFGKYIPSERVISMLEETKSDAELRLGILLSECDDESARRILHELKYSNAFTDAALRVMRGMNTPLPCTDGDVRRFAIGFVRHGLDIAGIRAHRGERDVTNDIIRVRKEGLCHGICELAIGGRELLAMGFEGKRIGEILDYLFDTVCDDPKKNNYKDLTALAKNFKF